MMITSTLEAILMGREGPWSRSTPTNMMARSITPVAKRQPTKLASSGSITAGAMFLDSNTHSLLVIKANATDSTQATMLEGTLATPSWL